MPGDEKQTHCNSPVGHIQSLNSLMPLSDDRYSTLLSGFSALYFHTDAALPPISKALCSLSWLCARLNAYIEEEVQRRLHKLNLLNGSSSSMDLSLSCESLRVRVQLRSISHIPPRVLR